MQLSFLYENSGPLSNTLIILVNVGDLALLIYVTWYKGMVLIFFS